MNFCSGLAGAAFYHYLDTGWWKMATYDEFYDDDFSEFVDEVKVELDKSARRKLDDYFEMRRLKQLLNDTFDDY